MAECGPRRLVGFPTPAVKFMLGQDIFVLIFIFFRKVIFATVLYRLKNSITQICKKMLVRSRPVSADAYHQQGNSAARKEEEFKIPRSG